MREQAEQIGFNFARKGCPCNGTPLIYTRNVDGVLYTLNIWEKRNVWKLTTRGCSVAMGNGDNLKQKITTIINKWD